MTFCGETNRLYMLKNRVELGIKDNITFFFWLRKSKLDPIKLLSQNTLRPYPESRLHKDSLHWKNSRIKLFSPESSSFASPYCLAILLLATYPHFVVRRTTTSLRNPPIRRTLKKDKILIGLNKCLTCWHLQKTSDRRAEDQFSSTSKGQGSSLDSTDPASRTVNPDCF